MIKKTKGLSIKCLKCKSQVTSKCGLSGRNKSTCEFQDKHRYNAVIVIPNTSGVRRTKILTARTYADAMIEIEEYRKQLESNGWQHVQVHKKSNYLYQFMAEYLNEMDGNAPAYRSRLRSANHIGDITRVFKEFREAIRKSGLVFEILKPTDINEDHLEIFYQFMVDQNYSIAYKNRKVVLMRGLFNFLQRKSIVFNNPFNLIQTQKVEGKDIQTISKSEFEAILEIMSEDNGYDFANKTNLCKSWMKVAFKIALFTGLRREELLTIRFSDIVEVNGIELIKVANLKVNRIMTGNDSGRNKFIPISVELRKVLEECGYNINKGKDILIIPRDENSSLYHCKNLMSRAFTHFSRLITAKEMKFAVLRKTYLTRLFGELGPNAKLFSGSSSDDVLKNHYLSQSLMMSNIGDFKVFQ